MRSHFFLLAFASFALLIPACAAASSNGPPESTTEATQATVDPPAVDPIPPTDSTTDKVNPPAFSFSWPTPKGWRNETIPFPLGFAPSLPYRGVEELRFGPGFFTPTSDTYFTYSFAFILEPAKGSTTPPSIDADQLASDLHAYFMGLMSAVGGTTPDPKLHEAIVVDASTPDHFTGTVKTFDAFGDGRKLALNLEAESSICRGRRVVLASLSPHDRSHAVWTTLTSVRQSFVCGAK